MGHRVHTCMLSSCVHTQHLHHQQSLQERLWCTLCTMHYTYIAGTAVAMYVHAVHVGAYNIIIMYICAHTYAYYTACALYRHNTYHLIDQPLMPMVSSARMHIRKSKCLIACKTFGGQACACVRASTIQHCMCALVDIIPLVLL